MSLLALPNDGLGIIVSFLALRDLALNWRSVHPEAKSQLMMPRIVTARQEEDESPSGVDHIFLKHAAKCVALQEQTLSLEMIQDAENDWGFIDAIKHSILEFHLSLSPGIVDPRFIPRLAKCSELTTLTIRCEEQNGIWVGDISPLSTLT
jgi:hypothetical protein